MGGSDLERGFQALLEKVLHSDKVMFTLEGFCFVFLLLDYLCLCKSP